jgi:fructose/tagatose bisphosphate aldolase
MEVYRDIDELNRDISDRGTDAIDRLVCTAVFSEELKDEARSRIREMAKDRGIFCASIYPFYKERPENLTVPAINIRGLTYDVARSVFSVCNKKGIGAIIFEIARTEMKYTDQPPKEYAAVVMAAAIKEGFSGPLFLQGDHFQVKRKDFAEIEAVKSLIKDSIDAGFYNIDLDTSTLVDLRKPTVAEQQRANFEMAAELTNFIREIEPEDVVVSLGGEIGEIGGKNSTEKELREYIKGYRECIGDSIGIAKIAVQTGTTHGGIPLADGSLAKVKLDFDTLSALGRIARSEYGLAGCVQHGASTLPLELFDKFPANYTIEVHLATEFQNIIYDLIPEDLREKVYRYLREEFSSEKKEGQTDQQFIYKTRKKGFGPFKKEFWKLDTETKERMRSALSEKFSFMFEKLGVTNTKERILTCLQ